MCDDDPGPKWFLKALNNARSLHLGHFGGTIFPLLMGVLSDAMGQAGAVLVMAAGVVYLFTYIKQLNLKSQTK